MLLLADLVREIHQLARRQALEQRQALEVQRDLDRVQHLPMILYILCAGQTMRLADRFEQRLFDQQPREFVRFVEQREGRLTHVGQLDAE